MKVRNTSKALRSYSAKDGQTVKTVYLQPGEEVEADFVETTSFKSALESGILSSTKAQPKAEAEDKAEIKKK